MNDSVFFSPAEKIFPWVLFRVPTEARIVFLTFDDGPDVHSTPQVLSILRDFRAKASFFIKGEKIPAAPGLLSQCTREGHSIGNHGFSHVPLWLRKKSFISEEIQRTNGLIHQACGLQPLFFRPPYGRFRPAMKKISEAQNLQMVLWNVDSRDYKEKTSAQDIVRNVLTSVKPGSVVLFHDSGKNVSQTIQALPAILRHLQDRGFSFSPLSELFRLKKLRENAQ
ncbi:peptidoglycan-N-acetylglucosamine deacetylase [bacterium BMS3Abin05]|nr:peptidoglycan-N-acetylglucosamine deacetylase [bacterium BMS3Abin05]